MFVGIGTAINIVAILAGSALGVLLGNKFKESTRTLTTDVLGLITLVSGASSIVSLWAQSVTGTFPKGWPFLIVLASLLLGGLLGSALRIESRLEHSGSWLQSKFKSSSNSQFVQGFIAASLVFAIGPLAILGSISDGMSRGIDQLLLKSTLDFFASIAFAATFGWGVAASAIAVGVYQISWTVIGFFLGSVLNGYQVDLMTAVGGILLLGIGLRLLAIKQIRVGDLLPGLFIVPLLAYSVHLFA